MLDQKPESWWKEIEAGELLRTSKLRRWRSIIDQSIGEGANSEAGKSDWPENHAHEYLSYMVPKVVFENPRATVKSRRQASEVILNQFQQMTQMAVMGGLMDPMMAEQMMMQASRHNTSALAISHGLNRWITDSDYRTTLDRICYDMLIGFGVSLSTMGVMPGHDAKNPESPKWPMSKRISPTRFVMDPKALHETEARWKGHWSETDKDDLLGKAQAQPGKGWDIEAINSLTEGEDENQDIGRKTVTVYQLWVPELQLDAVEKGFHGSILLLGGRRNKASGEQLTRFIRAPRPFFGPSWGPYTMFGAYVEPDCPYPLSPLVATYTQAAELNAHAKAMSISASQYKRLVLVSDEHSSLKNHIVDSPDMLVIPVKGLNKDAVVDLEIGGISDQQLEHFAIHKDRLDRISGLTDAQRGNTNPDVTATADAIADSASQLRVSYIQSKFAQGVRRDLTSKAWYLWKEPRVRFPLGPEAGEEMGMLDPMYRGGEKPDESFEDLELVVDAHSMQRTSEALLQAQVLKAFELLMAAAPAMVQFPWLDWRDLVRKLGEALNMPDLADVVNFELIQQMAQAQMAMGGPGAQPQQMSGDGFMRSQQPTPTSGGDRPARQTQKMKQAENRKARSAA